MIGPGLKTKSLPGGLSSYEEFSAMVQHYSTLAYSDPDDLVFGQSLKACLMWLRFEDRSRPGVSRG